jgi:hypothetical protein
MKLISPISVIDALITESNITADGLSQWAAPTTYAKDAQVVVIDLEGEAHRTVFESQVDGNLGKNPVSDDGTNWLKIGAPDRYKPFDKKPRIYLTNPEEITYEITPVTNVTGIGFQGLDALSITVEVWDNGDPATKTYSEIRDLVDTTKVVDYYSFFTWIPEYDTEAIFANVPGYPGHRIDITISAPSGTAQVGVIALGEDYSVGIPLSGTRMRSLNASKKDRDEFGNMIVVKRDHIRLLSFEVAAPTRDGRRLFRILDAHLDEPAMFYAGEGITEMGATLYGYVSINDIPLDAGGTSFFSVDIEGA